MQAMIDKTNAIVKSDAVRMRLVEVILWSGL